MNEFTEEVKEPMRYGTPEKRCKMQVLMISVLELKNPDGAWALALPGPNGQDRLHTECWYCKGVGKRMTSSVDMGTGAIFTPCRFCGGRGWLPTQNLGDVLEAARLRFGVIWYEATVAVYNEQMQLKVWFRGVGWKWGEGDTDEQQFLSCIKQALEAEGAKS